jgi:hypothetical protein
VTRGVVAQRISKRGAEALWEDGSQSSMSPPKSLIVAIGCTSSRHSAAVHMVPKQPQRLYSRTPLPYEHRLHARPNRPSPSLKAGTILLTIPLPPRQEESYDVSPVAPDRIGERGQAEKILNEAAIDRCDVRLLIVKSE